MTTASPCTGICRLDAATSWCLGCGRNGAEIAEWRSRPEAWQRAIWDQIPGRLSQMGVACQRLPWTTEDVRAHLRETLAAGDGTWVFGVVGAVGEFTAAPGAGVEVHQAGDVITARTRNAALSVRIDDDVRALTFDAPDAATPPRIVLAVKHERGRLPRARGVEDLGEDAGALIRDGATQLYDLGLDRKEARFCVRVSGGLSDSPGRRALDAALELPFADALPKIGGPLIAESPVRVIDTALGRVEIAGAIPPPTASSPAGPHTHLLPDHLATGRALPAGMELPRAYLPGAIFYPPRND